MPRKRTKVILGASVAGALVASGVVALNADAAVDTTPKSAVQAEAFSAQNGVRTEGTADAGGGQNLAYLGNGDWVQYNGVTVGATVSARISSNEPAGGSIELHAGSPTGALLATIPVAKTGGWQTWATKTAQVTGVSAEKQTVVAVLKSAQQWDFVNINWFVFDAAATPADPQPVPSSSSPSAPAPTNPTTPPAGGGGHSGPGWVPIDQTDWEVQKAAFRATKAGPVTNTTAAEFHAACELSHSDKVDPLVFPNMPGASHMHDFFGNESLDENSTIESLRGHTATSCAPASDLSAYWVPEVQAGRKVGADGKVTDGKLVPYQRFTVYYGNGGAADGDVLPFPKGFRMITGNAKLDNTNAGNPMGDFFCGSTTVKEAKASTPPWPVCGGNDPTMVFHLRFPQCWDGKNLDSPDHKSHVSFNCNAEFPVKLPALLFEIGYSTGGVDATDLSLSSGNPSTMHGDFMNAWDPQALNDRIKTCLAQHQKCKPEVAHVN